MIARKFSPKWYPRATWGMALGLFISLACLLLLRPGVFGSFSTFLEYDTLDTWFALREPRVSQGVAIVAIDSETVHAWDERVFDGAQIAQALRALKGAGVRAVALNLPNLCDPKARFSGVAELQSAIRDTGFVTLPIEFSPEIPDGTAIPKAREEAQLQERRRAARTLAAGFNAGKDEILPAQISPLWTLEPSRWQLVAPPALLQNFAAGVGHLNFDFDRFGRARNLPLYTSHDGHVFPSLAVSTARIAGFSTPSARESWLLNFLHGRDDEGRFIEPFAKISLVSLLRNPESANALQGRVVVLGLTASGMSSRYPTPAGVRITPTELHAVALDNLLANSPLLPAPPSWKWIFTILSGIVVGGFAASRRALWSAGVALLCAIAVALASLGLFSQNLWFDTAVPWVAIALTFFVGVMGRARYQELDATHVTSTVNALTRVSDIIAAQTRQWDLLDRVLNFATQALGAKGASALLLDDSGNTLTVAAALGPNANELLGTKVRTGEGIAGRVAQSGEAIMTNDAPDDPRFSPQFDGIGMPNTGENTAQNVPQNATRNLICVPLKVRERILGVIKVVNRRSDLPFSEADVELLGAVANQAAVALDNARLYDRLAQRVEQSQGALAVANRQLEADKTLLQTVLLSMTNGIVVTDGAGRIQLVNPAAQTLLPELSRGVLGQPLGEVLQDFSPANFHVSHAPREEVVSLFRGDLDAPCHIEARTAPLQSPDGEFAGLVAVFADITQRQQIEQAKSDFVSFVAHEMRSPLTSISGFSAMLQRAEQSPNGGNLPAPSKTRFLGLIRQESERLTRLINSLLDVAKLEAGRTIELNRDEVDFAQIAHFCLDSQRAYSSRHTLVAAFENRLPLVEADPDKVTQILINLISNALKYAPGGKVVVGARVRGRYLEVSVRDEGPGIAPQQKAILFSRFGRTPTHTTGAGARSKPTGTGLGLFLTKHFVEAHGGEIWVESEVGAGATFYFTLPLVRPKAT